jgi:integrase
MNSSPAVIPHGGSQKSRAGNPTSDLRPPSSTLLPNGRLRIRIELPGQLARPPETQLETRNSKLETFLEVRVGSSTLKFPYYKTRWGKYTSYTMTWHDGVRRCREKRSSVKALRERAEEVAKAIVNGQTAMLRFGQSDQASYLRALENLARTGKSLELATSEYAESFALLNGRTSLAEAVRFYLAQHPEGIVARTIADIVAEFLGKKKLSDKWRPILKKMLDKFAAHFQGPLTQLTTRDIDDWLDSLKYRNKSLGLRSRHNYREAVATLITFAKARGYLFKDWNVLDDVSDPEPPDAEVNLYTPDELVKLLNVAESYEAGRKLLPFVAITAFAGVRHEEMNAKKLRLLDWSDIDFEQKGIYVQKRTAKTGRDRIADLPENLIAWLQPYARKSGRVCTIKHTSNALGKLREKAGITGPRKNALRKSYITYSMALTDNIEQVSRRSGNSPKVIRKNYEKPGTRMKADALRWSQIMPERADVLPLFTWAKA